MLILKTIIDHKLQKTKKDKNKKNKTKLSCHRHLKKWNQNGAAKSRPLSKYFVITRTKSPRHKMNQFLPLNPLWSWGLQKTFPTITTAISTAMDTMLATTVTKLFRRHLVRQLIAADTCLPLVSDGCSQGHSRFALT